MIREDYFKMLHEQFNCEADYPFEGDFVTAVFRHPDSLKWFAIVMTVEAKKLGIGAFGELDIVNMKCSAEDRDRLKGCENVLPAYHMNKKHWISIILDEQEDFDEKLLYLTQRSYELTAKKYPKKRVRTIKCRP